jgi:hypothetical protein
MFVPLKNNRNFTDFKMNGYTELFTPSNFKKLFPIYEAYKLYGAIASFHINDDAKEAALNQGFFVLQRKEDVLQTDRGENLMVL